MKPQGSEASISLTRPPVCYRIQWIKCQLIPQQYLYCWQVLVSIHMKPLPNAQMLFSSPNKYLTHSLPAAHSTLISLRMFFIQFDKAEFFFSFYPSFLPTFFKDERTLQEFQDAAVMLKALYCQVIRMRKDKFNLQASHWPGLAIAVVLKLLSVLQMQKQDIGFSQN